MELLFFRSANCPKMSKQVCSVLSQSGEPIKNYFCTSTGSKPLLQGWAHPFQISSLASFTAVLYVKMNKVLWFQFSHLSVCNQRNIQLTFLLFLNMNNIQLMPFNAIYSHKFEFIVGRIESQSKTKWSDQANRYAHASWSATVNADILDKANSDTFIISLEGEVKERSPPSSGTPC